MKENMVSRGRGVTTRSILIGLLLCFCIGAGEPFAVLRVQASPLCADFSTGGAVFLLFLLVFLVNGILSRFRPAAALRPAEVITVYILMIVSCAIPSWGFVMNLIGLLGGVFYYADPVNRWAETVHPHLPRHLFPADREAILHLYEGLPPGAGVPWSVWVRPLGHWFLFILVLYCLSLCLMVMLRRQWVEKERLTYPLTELPRSLAGSSILRSRLMWLGFSIPFVLYSLRGLHAFFPLLPAPGLQFSFSIFHRAFYAPVRIYFEVIGLAFLMSTEVLLSVWLFAVLFILETGFLNRIGFSIGPVQPASDPGPQVVACQNLGALLVLSLSCLWTARSHLKEIARAATGRASSLSYSDEILPWRVCFWGFFLGLAFCVEWIRRTGMPLVPTVFFLLMALLIFLGVTRIIAAAGLAYYRAPVIPAVPTLDTFGSRMLGPGGLSSLGMAFAWATDLRTILMTSAANGLKLSTEFKLNSRRLFAGILAAIIVTLVSAAWCTLLMGYTYGGINLQCWQFQGLARFSIGWVSKFLQHPVGFGKAQMGFVGLGAFLMAILLAARSRFLWWPVSPIGMAVGIPYPVHNTWFSVFLAWILKAAVMKYGGVRVYSRAKELFLGMVLGAFVTAGIWILVGYFTGKTGLGFTLA